MPAVATMMGCQAQHFAAYLDALDPQRMFFDAGDISAFSQWRLELDNVGRRGNLDPAFTIFNRYHANCASGSRRL